MLAFFFVLFKTFSNLCFGKFNKKKKCNKLLYNNAILSLNYLIYVLNYFKRFMVVKVKLTNLPFKLTFFLT